MERVLRNWQQLNLRLLRLGTLPRLFALVVALLVAPRLSPAQTSHPSVSSPEAFGTVVLHWTAPGDDGHVGQAARYEIRWQPGALGPLDSEMEWQTASLAPYLPSPSPAGQVDSALVTGLVAGESYYFAARTYDEADNESLISNSPLKTAAVPDCCEGMVGDVNNQGGDEPTISDVAVLIDHLFGSQVVLWCPAEGDVNQSGGPNPQQGPGGDIAISDISALIDYLFLGRETLPECF